MRWPSALALLWVLFLVRGVFNIAYLPLWEGFDEWAHYAVIQRMATGREPLVRRDARVSREVQSSLELAPRRPGGSAGELEYGTYWSLPDTDRIVRERALRSLSPQASAAPEANGYIIYEAQQAPLYYWLLTPFYSLAGQMPFLARVWFLRLCSLLIGSAAVPLVFLVSREVFGCEFRALACAALAAAMPQLMMSVNHIGNECLSISMGMLFLFSLLRWKHRPHSWRATAALGLTLGLALLTKAYFLALIPVVVVFVAIWAKRYRAYTRSLAVLLCPVAISGWWYVRTWALTHTLSGEQIEVAGNQAGFRGQTLFGAVRTLHWPSAIDFAFLSHIWLGNWSLLVVRSWMYHFFAVFAALAAVGLALRFFRRGGPLPLRSDLGLLLAVWASFVVALGYQATRSFQASGFPGTMGYYLLAVAGAETILVAVGLEELVPHAVAPAVIPGVVLALAGLELFGINFYCIPYYTNAISRLPGGQLPALSFNQLGRGGFYKIFARLASGKPDGLDAAALALLWAAFLLATAGLIVFAIWAAVQRTRLARTAEVQTHC